MKKAPNSPRVISSMVAVALLGLIVGSPAWGDLFRIYSVPHGNSTNENHLEAAYAVVPNLNNKAILVFVQRNGGDRGSFICEDAKWDNKEGAYSCENPMPDKPGAEEKLTIGIIAGKFCKELRDNPERGGDKILTPTQCYAEGAICSCYEIEHRGPASDDDLVILGPPGSGAGSGKNN